MSIKMDTVEDSVVDSASMESPQPIQDIADTGEVIETQNDSDIPENIQLPPVQPPPPARPGLQRNTLQSAPPAPAPDPPQLNAIDAAPTDSLTLLQLRRLVAEVHRAEPLAYDFAYTDNGPHAEEIDEWFQYQFWQWVRLNAAQRAFEWHWENEGELERGWDDADHETRARFVQAAIAGVQSNDAALKAASIGKLVYLVLGRWGDTAMQNASSEGSKSNASATQLQAIKAGVECLSSLDGLVVVWEALTHGFETQWSGEIAHSTPQESQDELMNLMTIMYVVIQETLNDTDDMQTTYNKLLDLNPSLVNFMMTATTKLRWDEQNNMPQSQIFLLFWKCILLVFGGLDDLNRIKRITNEMADVSLEKETITASPLDYHVFRQEITSKYPAYVPPRPPIPLEPDTTSLLPFSTHPSRINASNGIIPAPPHAQSGGASIMDQPVHIATPIPSPPPSPAVGGKGGKKQNYQTNQNFPFIYPPLDATSNSAGGKGMMGVNQALVNRKWEGSDIPASILEAGQLFSSRVRMTRATRQLWDEREKFQRYERGWDGDDNDDIIPDLDLNDLTEEEKELLKEAKGEDEARERKMPPPDTEPDFGPQPDKLSDRDKRRLWAVEDFYRDALPHLQSLVIVLLRPILVNVTAIVAQQPPQQMPQSMGRGNSVNGPMGGQKPQDSSGQAPPPDPADMTPEDIDAARSREITSKAMTGILLLLLKWLRLSHVLKFEYLTQLLLDSNYVPLVLKLFAHQDVQYVVDSKMDRLENSFFQFCNLRSRLKDKAMADGENAEEVDEPEGIEDESEDDAAPPPIKRRRSLDETLMSRDEEGTDSHDVQPAPRPEVDELGCPITSLPDEPITDFSRRNFFSLINYLRIMQKICKHKAHRNLLLVQYKSSTILRKSLKVPQPELRLYTLKLFKNQVPYCGRKWRQGNMRVITAVYLHCRPDLRDEWLAGGDVDAEVDASLPLEQALRSLTHWSNMRRCPDLVPAEIRTAMREEQDFFTRELEKLDLNWTGMMQDEMEMEHMDGWA